MEFDDVITNKMSDLPIIQLMEVTSHSAVGVTTLFARAASTNDFRR